MLLKYLLAILFGALMTLSFAPYNAWWFQPFCLAGLFLTVDSDLRKSFVLGLCFGSGWFGAGMWWVLPGMVRYSRTDWPDACLLSGILLLYLSLFPALAMTALAVLKRSGWEFCLHPLLRWAGSAAVWTLCEWLRGNLFSGLPWLATGYAQSNGPLASFASLGGVLSLSYLSSFCAAMLGDTLSGLERKPAKSPIYRLAAILSLFCLAGNALQRIEWTQEKDELSVRLMQGNLSQTDKFSASGLQQAIHTYGNLASESRAELTVLPETAIPLEWNSQPPELLTAWRRVVDVRHTALLIGTVISRQEPAGILTTNSAVALLPDSSVTAYGYRYDKQHLIPFGEFFPPGAHWLERILGLEFSNFTSGRELQAPLTLDHKKIGISICFEDLFDIETLARARDADVLLSMSNFAWFRETAATAQHLQIAQVRAIESGRWIMQTANTGQTAIVDQHGRIRSLLEENVTGVLDGSVHLVSGTTPFMGCGNLPLLCLCLLQMIWAWWLSWRRYGLLKMSETTFYTRADGNLCDARKAARGRLF